jgi:hypothetical protein
MHSVDHDVVLISGVIWITVINLYTFIGEEWDMRVNVSYDL